MFYKLSRPIINRRLAAMPIIVGVGALAVATLAEAQFEKVGAASIVASVPVNVPMMSIEAKSSSLRATESEGKITLNSPLSALRTGINPRDEHLQETLNASKHPSVVMTVSRGDLKVPENNRTARGKAKGQLELNGVKRAQSFSYTAKRTGSDFHVTANFTIDLKAHKVDPPCKVGVCVKKDIPVTVGFKLRDK